MTTPPPGPPWGRPRHAPVPGYATELSCGTAVEAAIALQARCVCDHAELVHGHDGCMLCKDDPRRRDCRVFCKRRSSKLRAAAGHLLAALAALRGRP